MKKNKIWKKILSHILTGVMLVSLFAGVDMGWNVMEVQARYVTSGIFCNKGTTNRYGDWSLSDTTLTITTDYGGSTPIDPDFIASRSNATDTLDKSAVNKIVIKGRDALSSRFIYDFPNVTEIEISDGNPQLQGTIFVSVPKLETLTINTSIYATTANVFQDLGTDDKPIKLVLSNNFSYKKPASYAPNVELPSPRVGKFTWLGGIFEFPHTHSWSATKNTAGNAITLKCNAASCNVSGGNTGSTVTLTAPDVNYNGSAYSSASVSVEGTTSLWSTAGKTYSTTVSYYSGSTQLSSAPTNAGTYKAKFTAGGLTGEKEFTINKIDPVVADFTYTAPSNLVYDRQTKTATVTAKSGKTDGTITVKYYDSSDNELSSTPVNAGTYKVKITVTEGTNFNAVTTPLEVGTFTINKTDYTGTKTASGTLKLVNGKTTEITLPALPDGATYGSVTNSNTSFFTVGNVTDGKVIVTSVKNGYSDTDNGEKTFTVAVDASATLYSNYNITVTITPEFHVHNFAYSVPDSAKNTIVAECDNADGDCFLPDHKVVLSLAADNADYTGIAYIGASVNSTEWEAARLSVPSIMYEGTDSTDATYGPNSTAPTKAGEYKATVTVTVGGEDYTAEKTFTIEKATQSATVSVEDYKWGETLPTPNVTGAEEGAETTAVCYYNTANSTSGGTRWTDLTNETLDVGTYYIYAILNPTDNYAGGATAVGTFNVTGQEFNSSSVTAASYSGGYDGQEHTITFNITDSDAIVTFSDSVDGEYSAVIPTFKNAGDYTVFYRIKKFGHDVYTDSRTVTIAKKGISITPNSGQSKAYGQDDPVISFTHTPALCDGDSFSGGLSYTGTNAGTYPINLGSLSAGDNYNLTLAGSVNFEITKATYTSGPAKNIGYSIDYVAETMTVTDTADFELSSSNTELVPLTDDKVTPGETYYIRYKANDNQESSPWTAITLPARPAAPNAVGKQETIKNKKDAEATGVNTTMEYMFAGGSWTDVSDSKISNEENKNIAIRVKASNTNKNFHGEEKNIEFTASETLLKVRMGAIEVGVPYEGTVPTEYKTQGPTAPEGQEFMYWAFGGEKWRFTGDTNANKVTQNITLVPVFGVDFHGVIKAQDYSQITNVSLVDGKGNRYEHHGTLVIDSEGNCEYYVLAPVGVDYNLVIEGQKIISATTHDIVKTQLVNLNESGSGDATMPAGVFNSKVTKASAGEFEHTLVGGLDEIADAHENATDVVTVELTVSATVANDTEITSAVTGKTLDFVELTLTKTTNGGTPENIGNDNDKLLEIIVPYNTSGKYSIAVYRYHDGKVDTISTTRNADGEYIEIGTDTITIHAKKFSTYAIGYSLTAPSSGSKTPDKAPDDGSNDSGSTPTEPKKETPVEKKPQATTPKKIVKDTTPKTEDKEEIKNDSPSLDTSDKEKTEDENLNKDEEGTIRVSVEEKEPSKEAKDAIEELIKNGKIPFDLEDGTSAEVGMHFGKTISIKAMKTLANGEEVEVTDWDGKMTVTVDIPKDMVKSGRNYYVIAYVNGEAKKIPVTVNADNTITFDAEEGAEYAICYIDESEIPHAVMDEHNGKHSLLWLYLLLLVIFAAVRVITKDKKNPVKIALVAGDAAVAGLLLLVVKVCTLSIIVCLAEIAVSVAIHLVMGRKAE